MNMTNKPAPETLAAVMEPLRGLSTFDPEEFAGFLMISRFLPPSGKAAAWHARAAQHIEAAEELTEEAAARAAAGSFELADALLEGVRIRLAAAKQCDRMGTDWAAMHARYSD